MTIQIPDGVHRSVNTIHQGADDPDRTGILQFAIGLAGMHPITREVELRRRLNDEAHRGEYVVADALNPTGVPQTTELIWGFGPATNAAATTTGPVTVHLGNIVNARPSYSPYPMDRWPERLWTSYAARFARGNLDVLEEINRRRWVFAPDEWTHHTTLKDKDGDYAHPDWTHRSGNPAHVMWDFDWRHGWNRRYA